MQIITAKITRSLHVPCTSAIDSLNPQYKGQRSLVATDDLKVFFQNLFYTLYEIGNHT